jgi:DNA-binding transcriptional MerR regulator
VSETWTLSELVGQAAARLEALPPPKNGQVRAVPDERTIRYYATIGLLDRPAAMRGRTALYDRRHLAQVVAIKRMQSTGKSLAEIQALWSTLDDVTLSRMTGVTLAPGKKQPARKDFWKREVEMSMPQPTIVSTPTNTPVALPPPTFTPYAAPYPSSGSTTINLPLDGGVSIVIAVGDDAAVSLSAADIRALRAAAAPLVTELANRGLVAPPEDTLEEKP